MPFSLLFVALLFIVQIDRHIVSRRVGHRVFAGFDRPETPGSDDLQVRIQGLHSQLEADLVIAFARRAVADRVGAVLLRRIHEDLADEGPREGCAQKVLAFVFPVGLENLVCVIFDKFFPRVYGDRHFRAGIERLLVDGVEIFGLAQIDRARDDFAVIIFFQPRNDAEYARTTFLISPMIKPPFFSIDIGMSLNMG